MPSQRTRNSIASNLFYVRQRTPSSAGMELLVSQATNNMKLLERLNFAQPYSERCFRGRFPVVVRSVTCDVTKQQQGKRPKNRVQQPDAREVESRTNLKAKYDTFKTPDTVSIRIKNEQHEKFMIRFYPFSPLTTIFANIINLLSHFCNTGKIWEQKR